ncbi:beach domain-containing protein lvsc [Anaeramoeba ignava]|uniref:Beach domain-containing protein lvsc n=1 Tax=Anaeramoeba ignava TaxID=1746090 RepID=A0A9Q0LEA9_ANAIG|nr:beach domain-containing protein lvsc [Anaeramoeba ignava]
MDQNTNQKELELKKFNKLLRKQINKKIALMFGNEKTSDLKIYCGKDKVSIFCHKFILETNSKYFMIKNRENQSNIIYFNNFSSEIVKPVIQFFYTGKFKFDKQKFEEYYLFAHEIKSKEIKTKIELEIELILNLENIMEIYFKTQKINSKNLLQICQQFIFQNVQVIVSNPNFSKNLNQNQINNFIELTSSNQEIQNKNEIIQKIKQKPNQLKEDQKENLSKNEQIEEQEEKEFFTSFPNGNKLFRIWKKMKLKYYNQINDEIIKFCVIFQNSFKKWKPFETKKNQNEDEDEKPFEKYFENEEMNQALLKKEVHPIKFILFIISLSIYTQDFIKGIIQNRNENEIQKENIQGHKYLVSLPIITILSKSKYNRQILSESGIFQIIQDLLENTKNLLESMKNLRKSNPLLSIYYLMETQFILSEVLEILNQFLRERQVFPNQDILESIKQSKIFSLLIEFFQINLNLRKSFLFTIKQIDIQIKLLENFENAYELNLLKEKEKIDLILLFLTFFKSPNLSSSLPNIGFSNQEKDQIEIKDFLQTNFFVFDPKIKKQENPFLLQNEKMLKENLGLFEFDFCSNLFQFLTKIIEEENIVNQIINNNNISYLGDFILWVLNFSRPKLSRKSKDLMKEIEEKEKEKELEKFDPKIIENIKPKKVSKIVLYNIYFDTLFRNFRNFQYIENSNQSDLSKENIKIELDNFTHETKRKVNNFKQRFILTYLDLFKNPENQVSKSSLIHNLSNQKIIQTQKYIQNVFPQLQMYILMEFKRMIIKDDDKEALKFFEANEGWETCFSDYFIRNHSINLNIQKNEKIKLNQMYIDLQTLLINFMFDAIVNYQHNFDYKFLFNQVLKNQKIKSNLFLLNQFLEMIIEVIETKPEISSNKIIEIKGFQSIQEILYELTQENQNQNQNENENENEIQKETIDLCLEILDLLLKNANIEIIFENEEIIRTLIKLFEFKITQKIPFIYIPKILEKIKKPKGENEKVLISYLIQKILFLTQEINANLNQQEKSNEIELKEVEEFFSKCLESISQNREVIQQIILNSELFNIFKTILNDKEQNSTHLILTFLNEIIRNNETTISEFQQLVPESEFIELLSQTEKDKPSKKLFQILFNLMINNGEFSLENNFVIRNPTMIQIIFRFYSQNLDQNENLNKFIEVLEIFTQICEKSIHNIYCCCEKGIISFLLELIPKIQNLKLFQKIIQFIGKLATHKIFVLEMKQYFSFLKDQLRQRERNQFSNVMLIELRKMINQNTENQENPINFFDFYEENSNIQFPTFKNNLISEEFSFATWIRFEEYQNNINQTDYKTKIFSFLTEDSKGFEVFLEFNKEKKKPESFICEIYPNQESQIVETKFPFEMETKKWHFFVFTQRYKKSNSEFEISIYLDGKQSTIILKTRKIGKGKQPFIKNEIGSNSTFSIQEQKIKSFYGQMGIIYLFKEFLSEKQVKAIQFLGPNCHSFFYPNEFAKYSNSKVTKELKEILNGELTQKILVCHNPKEKKGNLFLNQSPSNIIREDSKLNNVYSFTKANFQDIAYYLGGIQTFFYLILEIDEVFKEEKFDELENERKPLFEEMLRIVRDVLLHNPNFQEQMIQNQGFPILSNILKSINTKYFSNQIYDLIKVFQEEIQNEKFKIQLKNHLIFDYQIWKNFSFEIGKKIIFKNQNENQNETEEITEIIKNTQNIGGNNTQNITIFDLLSVLNYSDEALVKIKENNTSPQYYNYQKNQIDNLSQDLFSIIEILFDQIDNVFPKSKYMQSLISECFLFKTENFIEKTLEFIYKIINKTPQQYRQQLFPVELFKALVQLIKEHESNTKIIQLCLEIIYLIDVSFIENEKITQNLEKKKEFEMKKLEDFYPLIHKFIDCEYKSNFEGNY